MKYSLLIIKFIVLSFISQQTFCNTIDSLFHIVNSNIHDTLTIGKLNKLIHKQSYKDCTAAQNNALRLNHICTKINYITGMVISNNIIGNTYCFEGNYNEALKIFYNNIELCKQHNLKKHEANTLNNLGSVNFNLKNDKKSIEYFNRAKDIYLALKDTLGYAGCYSNLGIVYYSNSNFDSSLINYKKAIQVYNEVSDSANLAFVYNNIGLVLYDMGRYPEQKWYLNKAISINKNTGNIRGLIHNYLTLAEDLIFENEYNQSTIYFDSSLLLAQKGGYNRMLPIIMKRYAKLDTAMNNYKAAYEKQNVFIELNDSINNSERIKEINELQTKYEVEIINKENQLQKLLIIKQKSRILGLSGLGILTVIIIIVLIHFNIKAKKASKKITEQQQIILDQVKELHENKINHYKEKIEAHQRELTTNALLLVESNEKINKIINEIRNTTKSNSSEFEKILTRYRLNNKDKFWQQFELRFEQVHQDFYKKITELCPEISPAEKKLCALLKLNMSTKDILAITYSTENSINVARSRIRTKLNLKRTENLVSFLNQL